MKYALVNQIKTEAYRGGIGICPSCGSDLIPKCGNINIHHWAHKGIRNCDTWWEKETEWHRTWKNNFPKEWQEVVQFDEKGEKHIADVKTQMGWVLEFQHSYINQIERHSRNNFYDKLVWVVDGFRRKNDWAEFESILKNSSRAPVGNINIRQVNFPEESRLIKEWLSSGVPVFFDFHKLNNLALWFLLPIDIGNEAYLLPFSKEEFIKVQNENGFDELIFNLIPNIKKIIVKHKRNMLNKEINSLIYQQTRRKKRRF